MKILIVVNFLTTIAVLVYVSKRFDAEIVANKETIAKQEKQIKLLFAENEALEISALKAINFGDDFIAATSPRRTKASSCQFIHS